VDADELIAFCRAGLASFKRPRLVIEVSELPKTATGKIQRYRLRERATAQLAPVPSSPTDVAEAQA
jgi:benzoate-CoA ligase